MPAAAAFFRFNTTVFTPYDGGDLPAVAEFFIEGRPGALGAPLSVPWRTSYADLMTMIRAAVVDAALQQAGVTIAPGDVTIYGGPMPTLADLGG